VEVVVPWAGNLRCYLCGDTLVISSKKTTSEDSQRKYLHHTRVSYRDDSQSSISVDCFLLVVLILLCGQPGLATPEGGSGVRMFLCQPGLVGSDAEVSCVKGTGTDVCRAEDIGVTSLGRRHF
jgi:hypothetical protein